MKYLKVFTDFAEAMSTIGDAEKGRLFMAMLKYAETSELPDLRGNERFVWPTAKLHIDRAMKENMRLTENGKMGGRPKATITNDNQRKPTESQKDKDKDKDNNTPPYIPPKPTSHQRGDHGYVKLTDAEYAKLLADLGEAEVTRVIAYVDESAASTENKNKWRNWNLVLRKASRDGWGKRAGDTKPLRKGAAGNHSQRKYTDAELGRIGRDLLEDV